MTDWEEEEESKRQTTEKDLMIKIETSALRGQTRHINQQYVSEDSGSDEA
jgi:hypothetical protein